MTERTAAPTGIRLPRIVVSSVIRSAHRGESHGGVYVVDLQAGRAEQVVDWDEADIDWEGRGGDRGLRGIAFHGEHAVLAASDELFVYDRRFRVQGSVRNPYLKHCHEICVVGDTLYLTSTGFDSILEYDLRAGRFTRGLCIRLTAPGRGRRLATRHPRAHRLSQRLGAGPRPRLRIFDPLGDDGPSPSDTTHLNSVFVRDGALYVAGVKLDSLLVVEDGALRVAARIPYGTHNARPFRDGVLMNHTAAGVVRYADAHGRPRRDFRIPIYDPAQLEHGSLSSDYARQGFGRGLAVIDGSVLVAGSSPATVTAYDFRSGEALASVALTMDVRNAIHGLQPWPFAFG